MIDEIYLKIFSEFKAEQGDLIPILQKVQEKLGYISEEGVRKISESLKISENNIYGVASFYTQFRFTQPSANTIHVCVGTACHVRGGEALNQAVTRELGITPGQSTVDGKFDFQQVACLGCCALAPVVQVNDEIFSGITANSMKDLLAKFK